MMAISFSDELKLKFKQAAYDTSSEECTLVGDVLARVGDKWSMIVVMSLGYGPMRFTELRRNVAGISQRMLSLTLRGLERDGVVTRTMFPTIPPRVDYALTEFGASLCEQVCMLTEWVYNNRAQFKAARERYDSESKLAQRFEC